MAYKVAVDAGHGGRDPGAVYNGRREKDDNLALALEVGRILEANGVDVEFTRTEDVYDTPYEKAMKGNASGADLFVSIHRNAFPTPNTVSGVETLVYTDEGMQGDVARAINENLASLGFEDRGVKERQNLVVLRRTSMPALLVEAGFIDSDEDNARFDQDFNAIALAIAEGILDAVARPGGVYQVQTGLFRSEANARRLQEQLAEDGFMSTIQNDGTYYKVLVGGYDTLEEAREAEGILRDNGYETLIVSS